MEELALCKILPMSQLNEPYINSELQDSEEHAVLCAEYYMQITCTIRHKLQP